MRVIALSTLRKFWESGYPDAEQPLRAWYAEAERANWTSPQDIKNRYAHASIVGGNRVVFNIGGNKYRLIVKLHYDGQRAFVRWVGTHSDYDKINVEEV